MGISKQLTGTKTEDFIEVILFLKELLSDERAEEFLKEIKETLSKVSEETKALNKTKSECLKKESELKDIAEQQSDKQIFLESLQEKLDKKEADLKNQELHLEELVQDTRETIDKHNKEIYDRNLIVEVKEKKVEELLEKQEELTAEAEKIRDDLKAKQDFLRS